MDLKELIKLAKGLDSKDKQQLILSLQSGTNGAAPNRVIDEIHEQKHKDGLVCPHCHSHTVVRIGKYTITTRAGEVKRQRYRCKSCLQTFNDLTNTPLQRTRRPHLWVRFIELMIEGFSLRKCAELMYEEVSFVTLFYWRHKILAALKQVPTDAFHGIVEMDETYFLYSEKGRRNITERKPRKRRGKAKHRGISNDQICVLVARDRQKMTFSGVLGRGRIRTTKLDEAIGSHLSNSNVLCTDSWRAFSSYANQKGLAHYRFKSDGKQRVKGVYHIQNVNSYHSRLKRWMDRFNGVSTKYLEHYLAWFRYLDSKEYENTTSNKKNMLVSSCLFSVKDTNARLRRMTYC
ncbi:IS1595 family transposase [Paenibacillus sp. GCM10027628]|uniref:IS1595 family transposase n=1 Tax=Paenibacillus sp. GCM10027628 TaxID=3273413 RepID=UPI00362961D2